MIAGFSDLPFEFLRSPHSRRGGLTINRLNLISVAADQNDVPFRLHYPGSTLGGVSGGPVFDAEGRLIGIHSTRTTRNIVNLINATCNPTATDGNCIRITIPGSGGATVQQPIGVNFESVKNVLENYSWATSIHALPQGWIPAQR
jgi:hypothetical protein